MIFLTRELEATVLQSELAGIACAIATVQRLYPETRAEGIEVAGGLAAFTGADSPLSQAYGVGASVPVRAADITRITEFYESRNATPRVFVTPLSDPSLATALAAAGYAPSEYVNSLFSNDADSCARRDQRIEIAEDLDAWARASKEGFADRPSLVHDDYRVAATLAASEGVVSLELRVDGAIAATAAMDVRAGCATLFAGSTVPAFRRQGLHAAMIRDRMARARDIGVRFMRTTATPASASERNFQRCGFVVLYTRTLWERPMSSFDKLRMT
jgi:GNAT superfamily N-acetyltransferase